SNTPTSPPSTRCNTLPIVLSLEPCRHPLLDARPRTVTYTATQRRTTATSGNRPRRYNRRMSADASPAPHRPSLQRLFLTGLLTLLPIWLTWVVIKFVFVLLSGISSPLVVPLSERIAASFPHYLGWVRVEWMQDVFALLATLLVILVVGALSRRVIGQRLLRWFGAVIRRIPLASVIYDSAKKLLDIL